MATAKRKTKSKSKGISTGWNPKTGKVGYTKSVKPKKPPANYASSWAEKFAGEEPMNAPELGHGMSTGKAQQWITVSAVLTAGMYFLRRMVEGTGVGATTSKGKVSSVLGAGAPAPLETWLLSYGFAYLALAVVAMGAPELAAAFAILIVAVNAVNNGVTISADFGQLTGTVSTTNTSSGSGLTASELAAQALTLNPAYGVAAPGKDGTPAATSSVTPKSNPVTGWVP